MIGEPKFTPGPWNRSTFGFQVLTGDSWNTICTLSGGAEWEDGRGKYVLEYEWQNQEANARLIAAAPEIYAALVETLEIATRNEEGEWADRARAALSKANPHLPSGAAACSADSPARSTSSPISSGTDSSQIAPVNGGPVPTVSGGNTGDKIPPIVMTHQDIRA